MCLFWNSSLFVFFMFDLNTTFSGLDFIWMNATRTLAQNPKKKPNHCLAVEMWWKMFIWFQSVFTYESRYRLNIFKSPSPITHKSPWRRSLCAPKDKAMIGFQVVVPKCVDFMIRTRNSAFWQFFFFSGFYFLLCVWKSVKQGQELLHFLYARET